MNTNQTKKRRKCKTCNVYLQRRGKSSSGTVRYYCRVCKKSLSSYQKSKPSRKPYFCLFREYVLDGVTYQYLAKKNHLSKRVLLKWFHQYLLEQPPSLFLPLPDKEFVYLIIDGKWNGKRDVTMLYRRSDTKTIIYVSVMKKEYGSLIKKDLLHILDLGYRFSGIVSDGGTGITKAIEMVFPHAHHQHCLAHAHRQYSNALGESPKDENIKDLKRLVDHLFLIESKAALNDWLSWVIDWYRGNWDYIYERRKDDIGRSWFAHASAKKVITGLFKTAKLSFHFLSCPLMPKTTNCLEASIGVISDKKHIHRGLKQTRQPQFINWYIYFYNQQQLSSRKHY